MSLADELEHSARVIRTYRFKLKPTRAQHNRLREALEHSRQLYNAALEERIDCYRKTGKGRSYMDQCKGLTELRRDPAFAEFPVTMQRGALKQIDQAFKAFFARGGFPRYKGRDWFKSISWPEKDGWSLDGRFRSKGLGSLRIHLHRPIVGVPRSARIKREGRHWYLFLACRVEAAEANDNGEAVGLDLGLSSFAALSNGTLIPNPRGARKAHAELTRRQRALARCKRGSRRRAKARQRVAAVHSAVRRARRTTHFQTAADLVSRFGLIAVENLNVKGLARSRLARDVNDAAWGSFLQILCDKAESAGRRVVKVDPRGTSQTCPSCGVVEPKKLSERVHSCPCGFTADRDVAAAQVILFRAVHGPAEHNVAGYGERAPRKAVA
jgi:putative transposase